MKIYLLRHGLTAYNTEKRYQGASDIPLSQAGAAALCQADFAPETVYVTPLRRTAQTAGILFPSAVRIPIAGLSEMDFGIFEGRNYLEMEHDPDYRAWVEANCETACPGGEDRRTFSQRVCSAFSTLLEEALAAGKQELVIVAHGGTQMAVMDRFVLPHRDYYSWRAPNGGGYVLSADDWQAHRKLELLEIVQYTTSKESIL